jgi:hypothetical protein
LGNPSREQINVQPRNAAGFAYGSIQSAINAGTSYIYLPCGTYVENVVIPASGVRIEGAELECVQLEPANPALPVISIDSTNAGPLGLYYDEVSNLSILCPQGETCGDGLKITGRTDIYQPNDWHKFSRLYIDGPFLNGIDLAGRTIWSEWDNVLVQEARGNGINIASSGTNNQLSFRNVRSAYNQGYGVYINNTEKDLVNGVLFDKANVEYNGLNPSMSNCAGMYLTGVSQVDIVNSYFEGNCAPNTADNTLAEIRLTGTYNQSVNIEDSVFNLQYRENGIYNDSIQTTGRYDGNKFTGSGTNGMTIYVATTHSMSNIVIGTNFSSTPTIIPDVNGNTHVRTLAPFGFDYSLVNSVPNNSIDVSGRSGIYLYYGPYTINNLINGQIGQIISVMAATTGGHVLTNSAGGSGQIIFPDGMNRTLNHGETILLEFDGANWRPIEGAISSQSRFVGTITTSGNELDSLAVPGISSEAHCLFSPTNAVASRLAEIYISVSAGSVKLSHRPTSDTGGTFNIFCSGD